MTFIWGQNQKRYISHQSVKLACKLRNKFYDVYFLQNIHETPHSSPVRARYGVSFVGSACDWYSTSVPAIMRANHVIMGHVITALHCSYIISMSYWTTVKSRMHLWWRNFSSPQKPDTFVPIYLWLFQTWEPEIITKLRTIPPPSAIPAELLPWTTTRWGSSHLSAHSSCKSYLPTRPIPTSNLPRTKWRLRPFPVQPAAIPANELADVTTRWRRCVPITAAGSGITSHSVTAATTNCGVVRQSTVKSELSAETYASRYWAQTRPEKK